MPYGRRRRDRAETQDETDKRSHQAGAGTLAVFGSAIMGAVLLLGACAPSAQHATDATATVSQQHLDVTFAPGAAQLRPGEATRLTGFLERHRAGPDDTVQISVESSVSPILDDHRRRTIAKTIADHGSGALIGIDPAPPPSRQAASRGIGGRNDNQGTVILARYRASAPQCRPSDHEHVPFGIAASTGFGCSTARNLAAQASQPRDLVLGREMGSVSAARTAGEIERYRAGTDGRDSVAPEPGSLIPVVRRR